MDQATHSKIVSVLWGIADDVLRDLFKRSKYPDVILPMCAVRRLDAVLEPTKQAVPDTTRYLYQPKPLRTLEETRADILAVQKEAKGLLDELLQGSAK